MNVDDTFEINQEPSNPPRFDAPSLQLESRGVTPHQLQGNLWQGQTIHKNSVAAKLRKANRPVEAKKLEDCHSHYTFAICSNCSKTMRFPNRCDLFYCAECQPRLANERRKAVEWWTREIRQPKHVVLTLKNLPELTKGHVRQARDFLTKLRRSKFARNWVGGFYSIEVTEEGRGFHLHFHLLVDARWIDAIELSAQWERSTNGMGRIVKVKDARGKDYLSEVTKYAVKGVQLAMWEPDKIVQFLDAFDGVRTFGVFGSLYGARTKFKEWFDWLKNSKPKCDCGCNQINYYSESEFLETDLRPNIEATPIPPPESKLQKKFAFESRLPFQSAIIGGL